MIATTSCDAIMNAMVTAVLALKPVDGGALTPLLPIYSAGRFTGRFTVPESSQDGTAGRTPAVQVGFDRERSIRTTIGRRYDRVEGFYPVYVITDRRSTRDDRAVIFAIAGLVRKAIGGRAFSLPIKPMRFESFDLVADTEEALVYALRFKSTYWTKFTTKTAADEMETVAGNVFDASETATEPPYEHGVAITFPEPTP